MIYNAFVQPAELFQALADNTRVRLVRLLVSMPNEKACICEFSESLAEPDYNISRHLKILRQAGVLTSSKEGRWVYHRLADSSEPIKWLSKLMASLSDVDHVFERDLNRFKIQIEKRDLGRCSRDNVPQHISSAEETFS